MPPTAKTGTGTTITSASTSFSMKVIGCDPFDIEVDDIDASNMESDYIEKLAADLPDLGMMELEVEYDDTIDIFTHLAVHQLWTIDPGGRGAGHLIKATGFLKKFSAGLPLNDKATGQVTICWDGDQFDMAAS